MQETKPTTIKSAIAAGLLGIFLGQFGAHDWYLGDKKKGLIHVLLFAGSFVVIMLSSIVTAIALYSGIGFISAVFGFLAAIAYLVMMANGIWGLVEGIIILVQGDAGLAAKGYAVAGATAPAATPAEEPAKKSEKPAKTDSKKSDK
jgi:TM2 domain-containing membrane protein YozV